MVMVKLKEAKKPTVGFMKRPDEPETSPRARAHTNSGMTVFMELR